MIYTRSSMEFILSALKCHDITSLNPGLNGGKIGYAVLIMSAFQKYGTSTVDTSHIDLVRNIIKESLSNLCPPDKGFMKGNSGIIWGLRKLYNIGIIEQSEKFDQFADIIIRHGLANFYSQSESITPENEIYPWGITLLPFWNGSDTLSRYLYEEKILLCYNRKNEMSIFQKRNEQIFSFFASFFLWLFRPLKHQLNADFKPLKLA